MKKKTILISILSILMCLSIAIGGTLSLVTSDDSVNIAVTSAKVDVVATIENLQTYSMENVTEVAGEFDNGGTAKFNDGTQLVLNKITSGDKATFDVKIVNNSDVSVSYRIRAYVDGEFANTLVTTATINGQNVNLSNVEYMTDWVEFDGNETVLVPVSVLLPLGESVGAETLSANVTFVVEAIQSNAAGTVYVDGKSYESMEEAIAVAGENGTIQISGTVKLAGVPGTSQVTDLKGVTIEGLDYATLVFVNAEGSTVTGTGAFANVNLKNLTVVDETFYYAENGENAWEFTYLELEGENTFTNVTFTDGIFVDGGNSTFTKCKFIGHNNDSTDKGNTTMYGAWVYSGTATFTGCEFTGTRGLKVADYYSGSDVTAVIVDNCYFGPLSEKPGIAVDNRIGELTLTIKNSTFIRTQQGDGAENSENGVPYVYENDNRTPDTTTIILENNLYPTAVSSEQAFKDALSEGGVYEITESFEFNVTEPLTITADTTIYNFDSDNVITFAQNSRIKLAENTDLTLYGVQIDGGGSYTMTEDAFTRDETKNINNDAMLMAFAGCTLTLGEGTVIKNVVSKYPAVAWAKGTVDNRATIIFDGATVTNCVGGSGTIINVDRYGDVYIEDGTVIANNVSTNGNHGIIRIYNDNWDAANASTLTMNGGEIRDNYFSGNGLIGLYYSKMYMNGGTISNNAWLETTASGNGFYCIVYVHSNSQFVMNGGEISGNTITEGVINAINSEVDGAITFNGGTVTNNLNTRNEYKDALAAVCFPDAVAKSDGTGKVLVISANANVTGTIYSHANLQVQVDKKYVEISDFLQTDNN